MSEELFSALHIFCAVLLLVLYVIGPILLSIMKYKKTKRLGRGVWHFVYNYCFCIVPLYGLFLVLIFNCLLEYI